MNIIINNELLIRLAELEREARERHNEQERRAHENRDARRN